VGLKETRVINHIRDNEIPFHQRNYKEFAGGDLAFDIDWDQWTSDHQGLLNLNGYVLQQFTDSLNKIGRDDAAAQALRDGVKTIKVVRVEEPSAASIALENGVLTFHVAPAAGWDGVIDSSAIRDCLLDNL